MGDVAELTLVRTLRFHGYIIYLHGYEGMMKYI